MGNASFAIDEKHGIIRGLFLRKNLATKNIPRDIVDNIEQYFLFICETS